MENLIGKKFVKVNYSKESSFHQEYLICDYEIIAGECIVYTSDGKSFRLDDLKLINSDDLQEFKLHVLEIINDKSIQNEFKKKFNPNSNVKILIERLYQKPKLIIKTFKIFGWTITLSKSK